MANPISPPSGYRKRVGIALGSGSARGIAHIGILQALREMDIEPDIICGSSIGALVGAVHLSGHLDEFADWVCGLSTTAVLRYMGIKLLAQGGVAEAGRLIQYLRETFGDLAIENLPKPYAAVATDLYRGREVWLQQGSVWDAVRASIAIPGLLTPVPYGERWLVDGGLVNPVPVSLSTSTPSAASSRSRPSPRPPSRMPRPRPRKRRWRRRNCPPRRPGCSGASPPRCAAPASAAAAALRWCRRPRPAR